MDKDILKALSKQINHEFYSSYLYLSMAGYCSQHNLGGFSSWLMIQAQEENAHALRLVNFITDRGSWPELLAIDAPPAEWDSLGGVFQDALDHERLVTQNIYRIYELAQKSADYATVIEMQWFISEQVEEEKNADEIVSRLELIQDDRHGLVALDNRLGERSLTSAAGSASSQA